MTRGIMIIQNAFKSKMQSLGQDINRLQHSCEEQRNNVSGLQKKNSGLEHELVESHQRHQQLSEENKELRKTVDTLSKQIDRLESLKKAVHETLQADKEHAERLGETSHLMHDDFLRTATPITHGLHSAAEGGFRSAPGSHGRAHAGGVPTSSAAVSVAPEYTLAPHDHVGVSPEDAPDGKQFFREARGRLSYEAFNLFLASIKRLNNQQQSREDTLDEAKSIFGPEQSDLYKKFEHLLNRHGM